DLVDVGDLVLARRLDALHELVVGLLHPVAHHAPLPLVPFLVRAEQPGVAALGEELGGEADLLEQIFRDELPADHADRTDAAGRVGEVVVAPAGQVIPAAGRHPADAHHQRLLLRHAARRLPHHFAGQRAAAGRVDANDDRLDVRVALRDSQAAAHALGAD